MLSSISTYFSSGSRSVYPGSRDVEFFGGEPLLYRGIWKLLRVLGDAGCEVAFPTNGTTLARHAGRLVSANPTRIWVSLDGPREINDAQRGAGVYDRATRGIDAIDRLKHETGHPYPELGVIFVVTPDNHHTIQEFFLELDLSRLGAVSIELQSYVTAEQHRHYARVAHEKFGVADNAKRRRLRARPGSVRERRCRRGRLPDASGAR